MTKILNFPSFQFEPKQDNEQESQKIVYDAWDSESTEQRKRLARKAIELDPNCTDAYGILAEESKSYEKKNEYYQKGLDVFRKKYGKKYFSKNIGLFWGLSETRPFMRLSAEYGQLLWDNQKKGEALKIYEDLLRLNPNDNQGLRYILINWLIDQNQFSKAKALLKKYKERSAFMLFSALLLSIKEQKKDKEIIEKYISANKENPFIVKYLLKKRKLPELLPEYFGIGDKDEAVIYCFNAIDVWRKDKNAIKKLKGISGLSLN